MYISNHNTINLINEYILKWIQNSNKIKPIFINGKSGTAKTFSILSILKNNNLIHNNYDEYSNYNELEYNILNKDILSFLKNKKKVILIDDFNNENYFNNMYCNIEKLFSNNKIFNTLVIIISNNILKKKIQNIKKYCEYFYFDIPNKKELLMFLKKEYNFNNKVIQNIIEKSDYNITKCILNLDMLKKNKIKNIDFIENYNNNTDNIDLVKNIFLKCNVNTIDDNIINYIFYHNLYNFVNKNNFNNKLEIIKKTHNYLLYNNLFEKNIYIHKNTVLKQYQDLLILYYQNITRKYKKQNNIIFNYTNYFSKHFILLNKNSVIERICINNNIKINKFNHNGLKLLYNSDINKKDKKKINKYNLYSII